jgi:RNA-binding protein 8A
VGECVLCITGLFEELQEEDLLDVFSEFGPVKNLHFNLDRRTGYAKGYAFIEYESLDSAKSALSEMNGKEVAGKDIKIDWAFKGTHSESTSTSTKSRRRHD